MTAVLLIGGAGKLAIIQGNKRHIAERFFLLALKNPQKVPLLVELKILIHDPHGNGISNEHGIPHIKPALLAGLCNLGNLVEKNVEKLLSTVVHLEKIVFILAGRILVLRLIIKHLHAVEKALIIA